MITVKRQLWPDELNGEKCIKSTNGTLNEPWVSKRPLALPENIMVENRGKALALSSLFWVFRSSSGAREAKKKRPMFGFQSWNLTGRRNPWSGLSQLHTRRQHFAAFASSAFVLRALAIQPGLLNNYETP